MSNTDVQDVESKEVEPKEPEQTPTEQAVVSEQAQEQPKLIELDVNTPVVSLNGVLTNPTTGAKLTFRDVVCSALLSSGSNLPKEEKVKRYQIAEMVKQNEKINIPANVLLLLAEAVLEVASVEIGAAFYFQFSAIANSKN